MCTSICLCICVCMCLCVCVCVCVCLYALGHFKGMLSSGSSSSNSSSKPREYLLSLSLSLQGCVTLKMHAQNLFATFQNFNKEDTKFTCWMTILRENKSWYPPTSVPSHHASVAKSSGALIKRLCSRNLEGREQPASDKLGQLKLSLLRK